MEFKTVNVNKLLSEAQIETRTPLEHLISILAHKLGINKLDNAKVAALKDTSGVDVKLLPTDTGDLSEVKIIACMLLAAEVDDPELSAVATAYDNFKTALVPVIEKYGDVAELKIQEAQTLLSKVK